MKGENNRRIVVRCPICNLQKYHEIQEAIFMARKFIETGIVFVKVPVNLVCEHIFYVEVDKNFSVRSSFKPEDLKKFHGDSYPHILNLRIY